MKYSLPINNPAQGTADLMPFGSAITGQAILALVEPIASGALPNPPTRAVPITVYRSNKTPRHVRTKQPESRPEAPAPGSGPPTGKKAKYRPAPPGVGAVDG